MLSGNSMVYIIILNSCSLETRGQDLVHYGLRKTLRVGSGLLNSYTGELLCWWKGAGPGLAATSAPSITDTSMRAFLTHMLAPHQAQAKWPFGQGAAQEGQAASISDIKEVERVKKQTMKCCFLLTTVSTKFTLHIIRTVLPLERERLPPPPSVLDSHFLNLILLQAKNLLSPTHTHSVHFPVSFAVFLLHKYPQNAKKQMSCMNFSFPKTCVKHQSSHFTIYNLPLETTYGLLSLQASAS